MTDPIDNSDDDLIDELYSNDYKDGWCGHDVAIDSLRKIIKRVRDHDARKAQEPKQ